MSDFTIFNISQIFFCFKIPGIAAESIQPWDDRTSTTAKHRKTMDPVQGDKKVILWYGMFSNLNTEGF